MCIFCSAQMLRLTTTNRDGIRTSPKGTSRVSPPFIPARDLTRGALHIVQTTLSFLFMLTVM